jgi:Mg-chelatase subunit ChlD
MYRRLNLLLFLMVFCLGQPAAEESLRVGPVYTSNPGELSVMFDIGPGVTVRPNDIQLVEDGRRTVRANEVQRFADSGHALAWVLCVDVSGTMRGEPLFSMKLALRAFIERTRPEDRIALITFADEPRLEAKFGEGRDVLERAVWDLRHRGRYTVLYEALHDALQLLDAPGLPERRRILVISDGKDEGSARSVESIIATAQQMGVAVDGIGHGKIDPRFSQVLGRFSDTTGGYFEKAQTLSLDAALEQIYERVMSAPIADFYYSTQPDAPLTESIGLRIDVSGSIMEDDIRFQAPRYSPPPRDVGTEPPASSERKESTSEQEESPNGGVSARLLAVLALLVALLFALAVILWRYGRTPREETVVTAPEESVSAVAKTAEEISAETMPQPTPQEPTPSPAWRGARHTQVGGYIPPPSPEAPAAILVGISGSEEGRQYSVDSASYRIGADPDNDLCILHDEFVSGRHASIVFEGGNLFLVDHGSRNGSFVNEVKVGDTSVLLSFGDVIRLGGSELRVDPRN